MMRLHSPLAALASLSLAAASPGGDGYRQQVSRIDDGIWVLAQSAFQVQPAGNVTVIEQADGLVLIDTGGTPGAARRLIGAVRGLSPKPVKAMVVTHWHGDHALGLAELLRAWPAARTIATAATQAHLRTPATMNSPAAPDAEKNAALVKQFQGYAEYSRKMAGEATSDAQRRGWEGAERLFEQYTPDIDGALTISTAEAFTDRLVLADPERPVELLFLGRGNTDGDAVAWLPRQRVVVSGDLVVAPIPFGFGSYPGEWIATLEKLRALDFAVLIPGHGPPQRDRAYLDRVVALLREVRSQVAAARDLPLDDARKKVDLAALRAQFTGGDPWLTTWFDSYFTQPIVASAHKEARGEPIVQSLR
jgi:glyoxylase-like metal-dependent hydrolase (beta-lactamase superfamily II)